MSLHVVRAALAAAFVSLFALPVEAGRPVVEVAFVLDTTGSMGPLIEGAKRKIWSIATSIVDENPEADIRMALVAYRDIGDLYVTKQFDLTTDIQGLYGELLGFKAQGGGDWPESVNEALDVAVTQLSWSNSRKTLKILFLVGDAPPHMNYAQDRKYPAVVADARRRGIIVNTVQAGGARDTERVWREIAQLADGDYLRIPQSGGVVVIETPFDRDIHDLQIELNKTVVPYGRPAAQRVIADKLARTEAAPAPAASDMAAYMRKKAGEREIITGGGDLVSDALAGRVRIDAVPETELPDTLKTLKPAERKAYVEKQSDARRALDGRMAGLVKQRDAYIAAVRAKEPNAKDSFDRVVEETLRKQMRRAVTN
jgi:Mg-chelatase subunit ChlD